MKLTNRIYLICLIIINLITLELFFSSYIKENNVMFYESERDSKDFAEAKEHGSETYTYVSDCNTLEDAVNTIGYTPIKEYRYGDDTYIFVSEGLELFDSRVVLYICKSDEKKLYKVHREYGSISDVAFLKEGWWYDDEFAMNLMYSNGSLGYYIVGGEQHDDVYYGAWFGDEIKNMCFREGKFEYSLLGTREGENVYFWTYELKNSHELLESLLTPISSDSNDSLSYSPNEIKELLGIKCKITINSRSVLYCAVTIFLLIITILLLLKTYAVNNKDGATSQKILLCVLTCILCVVVALLIMYFRYNPRLVFGN